MRGLNYKSSSVKLIKSQDDDFNNARTLFFKVKSERGSKLYDVKIDIDKTKDEISNYTCTCTQFRNYLSCKHIAACALKYEEELFQDEEPISDTDYKLNLSSKILDEFYKPKGNKIKKELMLEVTLFPEDDYQYGSYLTVNYRVGEDKLYTLNGKYESFKNSLRNDITYNFTNKFTYDPAIHYFNKIDKEILKFSDEVNISKTNYGDYIYSQNIDSFMNLLKNKTYFIKSSMYHGIYEENPLEMNLTKEEGYYILKINNMENFKPLLKDSKYIYDENKVYKLPNKISKLYNQMYENELTELIFTKKELNKFTNGILPLIKDEITLSEEVPEIVITKKPRVKLYFDFYYDDIECDIKLIYASKEINIFDTKAEIMRDEEYEEEILKDLKTKGFIITEENKIIMYDINDIGDFLDKGIYDLNEEYEVFTSEKMKNTNIIKNSNNTVTFKIGKDNILSYDFNLDNINSKELSDILASLKNKKKYHRLKNGDIINLFEDKNLKAINEIAEELELTNKDINEGSGSIPKYRAIYLDSLKKENQGIINTNNQFDSLIQNFKEYKDKEIDLEKEELKTLRDYQLIGIKWLYNIYKTGFGGILADEMGLGKSIQLIYLIKLIIKENPKAKILIVSPTSLIYNWEKEFDKFAPELKYKVFGENKKQRLSNLKNMKDINIFITSYGLIRNDFETYENINFELIAIDEAQNIKNPKAGITKSVKNLKANTHLALTGTPLENNVMELWSIFDFIMPGYLANNKKFQTLYNIKDMKEESIKSLDRLNKQIKYFILRRKKKDVVKDLPDKIENNIYIDLNPIQKKIYAAEVQKTKDSLNDIIATEGFEKSKFKILQLLTKLRQICVDPSIVYEDYKGESSKIEELLKIVSEAKQNGHKILIFTTYKKALDIIIPKLNNLNISSYYIDGSVPSKKRMELVEKFNQDDTDVFIITLKAGGTGLNLTSATVVIHLDLWWNPQVENQATDRAHRIGQKNTVEVIRIISKGTIEERILELQNKKRKLAELLIDNENHSENEFSKLTEKDIKMLLSMDKKEK